jgi:hypothetical protein
VWESLFFRFQRRIAGGKRFAERATRAAQKAAALERLLFVYAIK